MRSWPPSVDILSELLTQDTRRSGIGVDDDDVRLLGARIGITTPDEAYAAVEKFYRRERISAKAGFYLQTIFRDHDGRSSEESSD